MAHNLDEKFGVVITGLEDNTKYKFAVFTVATPEDVHSPKISSVLPRLDLGWGYHFVMGVTGYPRFHKSAELSGRLTGRRDEQRSAGAPRRQPIKFR